MESSLHPPDEQGEPRYRDEEDPDEGCFFPATMTVLSAVQIKNSCRSFPWSSSMPRCDKNRRSVQRLRLICRKKSGERDLLEDNEYRWN